MSGVRRAAIIAGAVILSGLCLYVVYNLWLRPTRILVVNPLPAQEAEIVLNNDSRHIKVV